MGGLDCPQSGPGLVWPLFADPGLGPQDQVQQTLDLDLDTSYFFRIFTNFYEFKLIFCLIFSP